ALIVSNRVPAVTGGCPSWLINSFIDILQTDPPPRKKSWSSRCLNCMLKLFHWVYRMIRYYIFRFRKSSMKGSNKTAVNDIANPPDNKKLDSVRSQILNHFTRQEYIVSLTSIRKMKGTMGELKLG
ncbi:9206_t:CDS:1, partial [Paraglomus brasilianum]